MHYKIVDEIPDPLEPNMLFIWLHEGQHRGVAYKCTCGCSREVWLPLNIDQHPSWNLEINNGLVTISPSILELSGCKSHYFIRNSEVRWC